MRNTERSKRFPITRENEIATFQGELEYYIENNKHPVRIHGKTIINIYKHINVQMVISKLCNYRCPFCIERDNDQNLALERYMWDVLEQVLSCYDDHGIKPSVSITGGEPTLFPDDLQRVWHTIRAWGAEKRTNINTNGSELGVLRELKGIRINLSRHHYCESKAREIFHTTNDLAYTMPANTSMQCVLRRDYIGSLPEIKKYIEFFSLFGVEGFFFRGLSALDPEKNYGIEGMFTAAQKVDFFAILNEVANDPDFLFVQQKIGDHYVYEIYLYKGKPVRFTYSNFEFLRKVETEERRKGLWYSRATIITPTGHTYAGWTYNINKIR